jgi:hypothetical protein
MSAFRACLLACGLLLASAPSPAQSPVVDVPMLFRGSTPAVEVRVNGQGPFLFAIDTGGQGMARVDASLLEKLKLQPVDTVMGSDGSGRAPVAMPVVRLDSVTLGGLELEDVRALSRDYNQSPNVPRIDGILGFGLFADYLLTLDFPGKRVRLERGALPKPDGAEVLGFERPRGVPVVPLDVCGHTVRAHLDSGNMVGGFILPTPLVERLTLAAPARSAGKARSITGETEIKAAEVKGIIRLGRFEFTDPTVIFPALSEDANVGAAVLREFAITFDQKNDRVRLERPAAPAEAEAAAAVPDANAYVGRYGERMVTATNGDLFLQRAGGPAFKMVRTGKDEFGLEGVPHARLVFVRDAAGGVVGVEILNREGAWEKLPRALL